MKLKTILATSAAALVLTACTTASGGGDTVTTPEGAIMQIGGDIGYEQGELSQAQLNGTARALFQQPSMNVFRRFPREQTEDIVNFYVNALSLRSLNPIQLTSTQTMILTGVGSGQIKLSAGQQGTRSYDLSGGATGGTGIRYFRLTYPNAQTVIDRFVAAGLTAPQFTRINRATQVAMVQDPAGFSIQLVVQPGMSDHSDDGVGIGIGVSNLSESRAFYREFVGLDELEPVEDSVLGVTRYPYQHGETTIYLHQAAAGGSSDNGSAGIQYVVSDAPMVAAMGDHRDVAVETPLNKLTGFDLITVWLNDPDGVTNYFAQVGPSSRTARGEN